MGCYQSKPIPKNLNSLNTRPQIQKPSDSIAVQENQRPKTPSRQTTHPVTSGASRSETASTPNKYELKPAHINTLVAKSWNPNDPSSWEPDMREYHPLPNSDYMLPSDEKEQDRLEMQHYVFRAAFHGDIVCPTVKNLIKTPGYKLLDVGCANGFWPKCVKKENPSAECHGVDISLPPPVDQVVSETDGVFLQFGNVLDTLPYPDNYFDYVHQRFLVLGVPREKFPDVLRELIRVTKPGGWIELVEGDVVIYNAGPFSQTLTTAFFDGLHRRGLDCYAASNLPWYVKQVAEHIENQEEQFIRVCYGWGSKMGILHGANVRIGFLGLEDWLHKAMGISREDYRELVQGCYLEWPKHESFAQVRALYFQVKK